MGDLKPGEEIIFYHLAGAINRTEVDGGPHHSAHAYVGYNNGIALFLRE